MIAPGQIPIFLVELCDPHEPDRLVLATIDGHAAVAFVDAAIDHLDHLERDGVSHYYDAIRISVTVDGKFLPLWERHYYPSGKWTSYLRPWAQPHREQDVVLRDVLERELGDRTESLLARVEYIMDLSRKPPGDGISVVKILRDGRHLASDATLVVAPETTIGSDPNE